MGDGRRPKRVAEIIRSHLAEVLAAELHDPRLVGAIVTRVEVTADLSLARVHVRRLEQGLSSPGAVDGRGVSEGRSTQGGGIIAGLERAAGRLRRGLGPRLGLKRVPQLRFHYDSGTDAAQRIEEILHELNEERQAAVPDDAGNPTGRDEE